MLELGRYSVRPFTFANLIEACEYTPKVGAGDATGVPPAKRLPLRTRAFVARKPQVQYLCEYLDAIDCASILVENDYVDRDFLEDYAAYYVSCFRGYSRYCKRLHFFSEPIDARELHQYLRQGGPAGAAFVAKAKRSYLGFSVLKPLPDAFIGRTCLRVYSSDGGRRRYRGTREYSVHMAGTQLKVESLAFQEQDTVLAACATTALWSALHKVGRLFEYAIPTPGRITAIATQHGENRGRVLPSRGLDVGQVCRAIQACGLEVELREGASLVDLKGLIYAYGQLGLPAVLAIEPETRQSRAVLEAHAVTVVGYSIPDTKASPKAMFQATSEGMNKFYVHDDQTGPFVGAPIVSKNTVLLPDSGKRGAPMERMRIFAVIIPVYPKIRVTYESAWESAATLNQLFLALGCHATWNLRVDLGTNLQEEFESRALLPEATRERVLDGTWPRFVWRASAMLDDQHVAELVLDATDIERSFLPCGLFLLDTPLQTRIGAALAQPDQRRVLESMVFDGDSKWMNIVTRAATPGSPPGA